VNAAIAALAAAEEVALDLMVEAEAADLMAAAERDEQ
jgi:hypothetical protein